MLLQFEPLHLNNPLLPSPAKQSPQNLHDLHCFNKGNDSSREFLPPCAHRLQCQYQADSPWEEQSHVHDGPPAAGAQLLQAWEPPASQHICPSAHPAASPAGEAEQSCATGFHTI